MKNLHLSLVTFLTKLRRSDESRSNDNLIFRENPLFEHEKIVNCRKQVFKFYVY